MVGADAAYKETANRKSHLEYYWKVEKVNGGYTFKNLYTGLYLERDTTKNGAAMRQSEKPSTIAIEYAKVPGAFNLVVGNGKTTNRYVNAQPDAPFDESLHRNLERGEGCRQLGLLVQGC